MPKYLDHHKAVQLPPQVAQMVLAQIKAGKADPATGIKPLNGFTGTNGEGWCLMEAPNADVVCKMHEGLGIKLDKGNVVEVTTYV